MLVIAEEYTAPYTELAKRLVANAQTATIAKCLTYAAYSLATSRCMEIDEILRYRATTYQEQLALLDTAPVKERLALLEQQHEYDMNLIASAQTATIAKDLTVYATMHRCFGHTRHRFMMDLLQRTQLDGVRKALIDVAQPLGPLIEEDADFEDVMLQIASTKDYDEAEALHIKIVRELLDKKGNKRIR